MEGGKALEAEPNDGYVVEVGQHVKAVPWESACGDPSPALRRACSNSSYVSLPSPSSSTVAKALPTLPRRRRAVSCACTTASMRTTGRSDSAGKKSERWMATGR
eukprot:scaffold15863_cov27-Tisochrysis_lutea.AAC.4